MPIIFQGIKIEGIISPRKQPKVYSVWFIISEGIIEERERIAVNIPETRVIRKKMSISWSVWMSFFLLSVFQMSRHFIIAKIVLGEIDFIAEISLS